MTVIWKWSLILCLFSFFSFPASQPHGKNNEKKSKQREKLKKKQKKGGKTWDIFLKLIQKKRKEEALNWRFFFLRILSKISRWAVSGGVASFAPLILKERKRVGVVATSFPEIMSLYLNRKKMSTTYFAFWLQCKSSFIRRLNLLGLKA